MSCLHKATSFWYHLLLALINDQIDQLKPKILKFVTKIFDNIWAPAQVLNHCALSFLGVATGRIHQTEVHAHVESPSRESLRNMEPTSSSTLQDLMMKSITPNEALLGELSSCLSNCHLLKSTKQTCWWMPQSNDPPRWVEPLTFRAVQWCCHHKWRSKRVGLDIRTAGGADWWKPVVFQPRHRILFWRYDHHSVLQPSLRTMPHYWLV